MKDFQKQIQDLERSNSSLEAENEKFMDQLEKSCALCAVPDRLRHYAETEFRWKPKLTIQKGLIIFETKNFDLLLAAEKFGLKHGSPNKIIMQAVVFLRTGVDPRVNKEKKPLTKSANKQHVTKSKQTK